MQNHSDNGSVKTTGWMSSTIGRKQLVGVTGLGLSGFVLTHMLGNMLILVGPQAYNQYAHALVTNPFIYIAEAGLIAMFLAHMFIALRLSWSNWNARDFKYAMRPSGAKRTTFTQRSLWAQGLLILAFTILHLITFKYGPNYTANYGGIEMRDLHKLVIEVFQEPVYVAWYIVALIVLGFHLSHGVGSSLQTLGIHHIRYQRHFKTVSIVYALIVTVGFLSQPIYVYFLRG